MNKTLSVLGAVIMSAFTATPAIAQSETYPSKPVRLIVPGPPASVTDVRARWIVEQIAPTFGQPIIVENRPGASGNIASEFVVKSAPDGYTIALIHQGTVAINPHVYAKLSYDALNDFAPITMIARNPLVLAVHPDVPAKTGRTDRPGEVQAGTTVLRVSGQRHAAASGD